MAETLVTTDKDSKLVPGLAECWTAGEHALNWRFSIREKAVFHDGSVVTTPGAGAGLKQALARVGMLLQAPIAEIGNEGRDVAIRLTKPFSAIPAHLMHFSTNSQQTE